MKTGSSDTKAAMVERLASADEAEKDGGGGVALGSQLPGGYWVLTVAQLKDELRCRGLAVSGTKAALVAR